MANSINVNDTVSVSEALHMEIMINQALVELLVDKGLISQEELLERINTIRYQHRDTYLGEVVC